MKEYIKRALIELQYFLQRFIFTNHDRESLYQQIQQQLVNQYALNKVNGINPFLAISDTGFRCYSQFEEDGIILFVLTMVGFKSRRVVELCCGRDGECMASNLILNHGFYGYLFDGDKNNVASTKRFFKSKKDCLLYSPTVSECWITAENVNDLLKDVGAEGEIDLLSLDIDGNDYWVWKAIDIINPRLCVFETHNIIPDGKSLTINYEPDFCYLSQPENEQDYRGVSLAAMVKLSKQKGYRLIGAHRHGFNAFFLRDDIAADMFPEVSIEEVHNNYSSKTGQKTRWPIVKDMKWVKV